MKFWLPATIASLALGGCDSRTIDSSFTASPNGFFAVEINKVSQGASDEQPFSIVISAGKAKDRNTSDFMSVLTLLGQGSATANWNSDQEVVIHLDQSLHDNNEIPARLYAHNIDFVFPPPAQSGSTSP